MHFQQLLTKLSYESFQQHPSLHALMKAALHFSLQLRLYLLLPPLLLWWRLHLRQQRQHLLRRLLLLRLLGRALLRLLLW
jgi:hypothetical protein